MINQKAKIEMCHKVKKRTKKIDNIQKITEIVKR